MLHGNYSVLCKSPGRFLGGSSTSVETSVRSNFGKAGPNRNAALRDKDTVSKNLWALPTGNYRGWMIPIKSGEMSSANNAIFQSNSTATIAGGITTTGIAEAVLAAAAGLIYPLNDTPQSYTGSSSMSFSFADAYGQLIASGSGSGGMSFSEASALLTASINATGVANFTVAGVGVLGALASSSGLANLSFTVTNTVQYPVNDSSPIREGTASAAFNGTLEPYATGTMSGSTVDNSVLTSDKIAGAVWGSVATQFTDSQTMGGKLNTASAGGVDLSALAAAVWEYASRTLTGSSAALTLTQATQLEEVWKLHGLDPAATLSVTATTRTAGSISQTLNTNGSTTTVARVE